MIDGIGGVSGADSALFGPDALGKEDFLKLLVTQLQYQDPLDPLDAQDFASQLAEFTALEQQVNTNRLIEQQIELNSAAMIESQNSVAIGLIGTGIVAEGDSIELSGSPDEAAYVAASGQGTVTLSLTNADGEVVHTVTAPVAGEGVHRIDLGGEAQSLPPGHYTLFVETVGGSDDLSVRPLSSGVVQGVRWGDTGPVLVVGDTEVPLSNVLEITNSGARNQP